MIKQLKQKYNKWLFYKFGFERGALFENIPARYKANPLFSPSIYGRYEGEQFAKWFREGVEAGMKEESNLPELREFCKLCESLQSSEWITGEKETYEI